MNPFSRANPMSNFMRFMNQYRQIKQNPGQLSEFLSQKGMISPEQAQEIQMMGNNYSQIGQYLMNSGTMPKDIPQNVVNQAQSIANQ